MKVKIKKLHPEAIIPHQLHKNDAGYDIRAIENVTISAGKWKLIKTGIAVELPQEMEIQVRSRSGLAFKNGIFCLNAPGTIDAGYRNEIGVILANFSDNDFEVKVGDRVAQLIFQTPKHPEIVEVEELADSDRGLGGFGSSGNR
ncbi:MAG: dUTP diphosphatase [Bacteroidota bacterium]|nr:dUTP diphosphatase [Bacteroidota bacterium]